MKAEKLIMEGAKSAFIDGNIESDLTYKPQLLFNDYSEGKKILCSITQELDRCDEFIMSVAFITEGGITPLLQILRELSKRGIKGKILTTDYLYFTQPKAVRKLMEFENIEVRVYLTKDEGFHTKGYIFKRDETYRIIVGSSNLTQDALSKNREWNTSFVTKENGEITKEVLNQFYKLWQSDRSKKIEDIIYEYELNYLIAKEQKTVIREKTLINLNDYKLVPNSMQTQFIMKMKGLIEDGAKRALLISATGTGKTFASAFALRELKAKRVLFLVHREQIARHALDTYKRVFPDSVKMGLISGNRHDYDSDFVFATMQMMSKDYVQNKFNTDDFDYIVIDEVHRAGSLSYSKIFRYFNPDFFLGMTASPQRTDGFDIYELFDHNIASEIRLNDALKDDLLCPFHYFGISELITLGGEEVNDFTKFNLLTQDERVNHIIREIKFYGYSGDRVKGLIFCSSKEEAKLLSNKFNERGFRTLALTSEDIIEKRQEAITRLVGEKFGDYLDYIFTVDIFNEGIDIPEINQVVLLRPTQSPIIFIQQLGRGLRKAKGKEFVVIIDFIGNYTNNFMIPMALYGDRRYNKDDLRRHIMEGNRTIPGASTVHFDEVSRKRIFESIDSAKFNSSKIIVNAYNDLKYRLGRIPRLMDFEEYGSIDVLLMFNNNNFKSYHTFLKKNEKEYNVSFTPLMEKMLEFMSRKFASGKRIHELIIFKEILNGNCDLFTTLDERLTSLGLKVDENTNINVRNILSCNFDSKVISKNNNFTFIEERTSENGIKTYCASREFLDALKDTNFKNQVNELVDFALYRHNTYYSNYHNSYSFNLYQKYTYEDVCRILEWDKNIVPLNIGGYKFDQKTKTYPVFINYHKDEKIADTIKYEDRFIDNSTLLAISKSGRTKDSSDVRTALNASKIGVRMDLFVRKDKDDAISNEFYYLGEIKTTGKTQDFIMANTNKTAVEIEYKLETPLREDLYEYITNNFEAEQV